MQVNKFKIKKMLYFATLYFKFIKKSNSYAHNPFFKLI